MGSMDFLFSFGFSYLQPVDFKFRPMHICIGFFLCTWRTFRYCIRRYFDTFYLFLRLDRF